ncbi:S8 family peptidase [Streptomyces sp. URMC 123]|uniref:S8 family peptidase n=1 Tax=Streptomyces sp. URMC 123 TaxID=3423403 RepID=UPI003F1C4AFC
MARWAPGAVGGSYIVTLKSGAGGVDASAAAGRDLLRSYGAKMSHLYGAALNGFAITARPEQAARLAADPRVASVTQDSAVAVEGRAADSTPTASWGLDRIDQRDLPLDGAYRGERGEGAGVRVHIIDTGIRADHQEFGGRASSGWDFVDNDAEAEDGNGHGTHVAGVVAGASRGVAKGAEVVAVRVLDDEGAGTAAQVIAGVDWVTRHARKPAVANLSLSGPPNAQLDTAIRNAVAAGVTFTVAAGNEGRAAGEHSPGRVREALTVAATDRADRRPRFANWGASVDLFAPGVDITSAWNTSTTAEHALSGTSMAAPHAAGAAALHLARHPTATPAEVCRALIAGAGEGRVRGAGQGSPNRLLLVGDRAGTPRTGG